jgi:anaerobic ribonucleoside-triphosphate reductase activating protein
MDLDEIMEIVRDEDFDVTLSGGDPLYQPEVVGELARRIRETGHTVWVYTGFTWEQIQESPRLRNALNDVEAIVEGPFIETLRDTDLRFRGSSNQRIIYLDRGIEQS